MSLASTAVLSAVGIALDMVGAVALAIGLFGHARPLYPGWLRSPEVHAHDASFGTVGATFLVVGFTLQSLTFFGVAVNASHRETLVAAVIAVVVGSVIAFFAYGFLYLVFLGRERRWALRETSQDYPVRRRRQGIKFWKQERL